MKYCSNCGNELNPNSEVCLNCGVKVKNTSNIEDNGGIGYTLLGFFIPVVGLILWLIWKDTKPNCSKAAKKGFITYIILWAVLMVASILLGILAGMM